MFFFVASIAIVDFEEDMVEVATLENVKERENARD